MFSCCTVTQVLANRNKTRVTSQNHDWISLQKDQDRNDVKYQQYAKSHDDVDLFMMVRFDRSLCKV